MSTAPQQDLLTSTQPQAVVSNVLISVCSQLSSETLTLSSDPSVSTRDQPLASPAICSSGSPAPLPTVSGTATSEVPRFSGHTLPPSAYGIVQGIRLLMFLQPTWLVCCPLLLFHRTQFVLSRLGPRLRVFHNV